MVIIQQAVPNRVPLPPVPFLFLACLGQFAPSAHLEGGAATDGAGVETLDLLAVVVHGDVLLGKLCQQSAAGGAREEGDLDDFPDLGNYVDSIRRVFVSSVRPSRWTDSLDIGV